MGFRFDILHDDPDFVVIDKPEGFHVHPHENERHRVGRAFVVLQQLRNQLGTRVYPIHRLDAATSGCLLVGLNPEAASRLGIALQKGDMQKTYRGLVRGWTEESFSVERPLPSEDGKKSLPAHSRFRRLAHCELPYAIGVFPTARYSLLEMEAVTGRYHQLRRHLNGVAHPLVGDVNHGDRHHNRLFRETLGISGLCLRAVGLEFAHPRRPAERVRVAAPSGAKWQRIDVLLAQC